MRLLIAQGGSSWLQHSRSESIEAVQIRVVVVVVVYVAIVVVFVAVVMIEMVGIFVANASKWT